MYGAKKYFTDIGRDVTNAEELAKKLYGKQWDKDSLNENPFRNIYAPENANQISIQAGDGMSDHVVFIRVSFGTYADQSQSEAVFVIRRC